MFSAQQRVNDSICVIASAFSILFGQLKDNLNVGLKSTGLVN